VPVTGLTGDARPQPVAPTVKISSFLPLSLLSPLLFTSPHPLQNLKLITSSLFHSTFPPWRLEDSTKEKAQDWKQKDLSWPLFTFPFKFFGFNSSLSLQRYSNLLFARYLYMV
jgi:hypothetical protein